MKNLKKIIILAASITIIIMLFFVAFWFFIAALVLAPIAYFFGPFVKSKNTSQKESESSEDNSKTIDVEFEVVEEEKDGKS